MNTFLKTAFFGLGILFPLQPLLAIEPAAFAELLKDAKVQEFVIELSKLKEVQPESIMANFAESGRGIKEGFHGLGLGASRLLLEGSRNFRDIGASLAKHYWVLGGLLAGSVWFYLYVLPKLCIQISYSSDAQPALRRV